MLELKDKCLHPETNKPYLKMGIGGINNSPEGIGVCRSASSMSYCTGN